MLAVLCMVLPTDVHAVGFLEIRHFLQYIMWLIRFLSGVVYHDEAELYHVQGVQRGARPATNRYDNIDQLQGT